MSLRGVIRGSAGGGSANLVTAPYDIVGTSWTKNATTAALDTVAPDGSLTATTVAEATASNTYHDVSQVGCPIVAGALYTFSVYLKAGARYVVFYQFGTSARWLSGFAPGITVNLTTGTISWAASTAINQTVTSVGDGWFRCQFSARAVTSGTSILVFCPLENPSGVTAYAGQIGADFKFWGPQVTVENTDPHIDSVVFQTDFEQAPAIDSSPSGHSWTLSGSTYSLSQAKFNTGSLLVGAALGGNNVATVSSPVSDWQFGASPFTVECWIYLTDVSTAAYHRICGPWGVAGNQGWSFRYNSGGLGFGYSLDGTTTAVIEGAWSPSANTWYHVAVDRDAANNLRTYVDGVVKVGPTQLGALFPTTSPLLVGNTTGGGGGLCGYIDELRITKGVARYGGAFTAPTAQFPRSYAPAYDPSFSSTVLLCGFDDDAPGGDRSNRHAITLANGAVLTSAQSKFGGRSARIGIAPTGGCYVSVSEPVADWNFGAGAFTIETWVCFTDTSTTQYQIIIAQYSGSGANRGWLFRRNSTTGILQFYYSADGTNVSSAVASAWSPNAGQWYHVCVERDAASNMRLYIDGVVVNGPVNVAAAFFASTLPLYIGNDNNTALQFVGYIDEVRITKGLARYGGAFTPSTTPLGVNGDPYYDNVVLLTGFDAVDRSSRAHSIATTGATMSTAQEKFGDQSMLTGTAISGTNKVFVGGSYTDWNFGSAPFTIECWIYFTDTSTANVQRVLSTWGAEGNQGWSIRLYTPGTFGIAYTTAGTGATTATCDVTWSPTANTWYHIAVDRDASNIRLYIDGVVMNTRATATFFPSTLELVVGNSFLGNQNFVGYIDDVRITKGIARYAGAFTPPAFPNAAVVQTASVAAPRCVPALIG